MIQSRNLAVDPPPPKTFSTDHHPGGSFDLWPWHPPPQIGGLTVLLTYVTGTVLEDLSLWIYKYCQQSWKCRIRTHEAFLTLQTIFFVSSSYVNSFYHFSPPHLPPWREQQRAPRLCHALYERWQRTIGWGTRGGGGLCKENKTGRGGKEKEGLVFA